MTHSTYRSVRGIVALLKKAHRKKVYTEKDVRFAIQIAAGAHPNTVKGYFALMDDMGIIKKHNDGFVIDEDKFLDFARPFSEEIMAKKHP